MKFRFVIILVVVMLAGAPTLMAGGTEPSIRVDVPFAFRVGQQLMPAGQYQIAHVNAHDLLVIRSMNGDHIRVLISECSGKYAEEMAKLVFNRYGEAYFLRQVWIPEHHANELLQSKTEKEYASRWGEAAETAVVASMYK